MNKSTITGVISAMEKSMVQAEHGIEEPSLFREVSQGLQGENSPPCRVRAGRWRHSWQSIFMKWDQGGQHFKGSNAQ